MRAPVCSLLLLLALAPGARATERFDPTKGEAKETKRWARTELLVDEHPQMKQERFIPLVAHHDPELAKAFGSATPPSSRFLLHFQAGWDRKDLPHPPVLLIHGAGLSSNHCYADHPIMQPYEGLAAHLAKSGRAVFALSFSHVHGDNYLQAEALADAIARIRHLTGAAKVDLVAHSKGGMAARIYLSSAGPAWSTKFRKDVRRYVMLGTPNGGIDVSFAYPNLNYWVLEHKSPAPLSWTEGMYWGKWLSWKDQTVYGPDSPFPGQAQLVARWDQRYGRTTAKGQLDVDTTYEGGRGQASVSLGIERAIADGGDCIAKLAKKPIHASVELAALAGNDPWVMGLVGERRGPSDGLLLVASALATEPLTRGGAKLLRADVRFFNHLQLVYHPRANAWVREVLDLPSPAK
ncbi:MAG: esterase/lipase family protein [Planctomycetota bacterium]